MPFRTHQVPEPRLGDPDHRHIAAVPCGSRSTAQIDPFAAFVVAISWGLVIMGIDRWLIISMPTEGKRRFAVAAPRLLLGVLLGSLISTPIVLRIFESEITLRSP